MKDIGTLVFQYRSDHKMTQERFAELSKISRLTINQIENSKNGKIQAGTYGKIMKILKQGDNEIKKSS